MKEPDRIIHKILQKHKNSALIEEAFAFAKEAYKEKVRISGENYIFHATRVAAMLDNMGVDETTLAFALLHDILDNQDEAARNAQQLTIEKKFGKEMFRLMDNISKLARIRYSLEINVKDKKTPSKDRIENTRRMFLAIAGDVRVIVVELAARLDGLKFLGALSEEKQRVYALETLRVFVPLASRLGLSQLKRQLEDDSFAYLFPDKFNEVKGNIEAQYEAREKYLRKFIGQLQKIFKKERVKVIEINFRTKSYWSTYRKLLRKKDFNKIYDLLALRIITDNVEHCYKILGVIHKYFSPLSEEINDYIAHPKKNGYRSLHTTVRSKEGKITEIQIRTPKMHEEAEFGVCAHWAYKENIHLPSTGEEYGWVKEAKKFREHFSINFFENQVFAFTPRGDVIGLPKDSTPVDFAYAIHSEIGDHCAEAKVNGKIVPLSQKLQNGDIIEITTSKTKTPSKDWLRFVKTSFARGHIKKATEEPPSRFKFPIPGFITKRLSEFTAARKKEKEAKVRIEKEKPNQIYLAGQKGILIRVAKCCNPTSRDKVKAYLAPHRAAVLHRTSCPIFRKISEKFPEKIIDASWSS